MTCKDCVHYKPCFYANIDNCEYFKDKSKFIDLPCKVGDTVYIIRPPIELDRLDEMDYEQEEIYECKVKNIRIYTITNDMLIGLIIQEKVDEDNRFITCYMDLSELGKTVFLTREAAETALKEREQNE